MDKQKQVENLILESVNKCIIETRMNGNNNITFFMKKKKIIIKIGFDSEKRQNFFSTAHLQPLSLIEKGPEKVAIGFDRTSSYTDDGPFDLNIEGRRAKKFGRKLFNALIRKVNDQKSEREDKQLDNAVLKLSGFDDL